eukprot:TRINITY_DN11369_c0_g1_i1.p3 TRINITY_DN11369_c0_g1~~TRINITY_DN11369_c0_g1_i1.p3  ORF type:complete len:139 (-),score=36.43 TRINITY_DN11369_c0_g1_i1:1070-1486(-)
MCLKQSTICGLSAEEFLAEAGILLAKRPAQYRRVAKRAAEAAEAPEKFRLFVVRNACGWNVGAVIYEICSSYVWAAGEVSEEAAHDLIEELVDEFGFDFNGLSGCDGPPQAVEGLSAACCEEFGCVLVWRRCCWTQSR